MKTFLARLVFVCQRPRCFGKVCTSIVTRSMAGGDKIVEYLDVLAMSLGFNVVKGACVTALDPSTQKDRRKTNKARARQAKRFYARLAKPAYPAPTLLMLMVFWMGRNGIRQMLDDRHRDYRYYLEKRRLESDYYYPVRLALLKKVAGELVDSMAPTLRKMIA